MPDPPASDADPAASVAVPAATVVVVRDGAAGLEVLMLRRDAKVAFGGMWVFPGGKVDPGDHDPADTDDEAPARRAAVREAAEECGLVVDAADVVPFAHWTPPAVTPRRFSTWFFLAPVAAGEVVVDGREIREHQWWTPAEVLARRDAGEVELAPPTWVTLWDLGLAADVAGALAAARARDPIPRYVTRWVPVGEAIVAMWAGDAGYEAGDPHLDGPRHRLIMDPGGWRFERD